jgi:hypothetical protein
MIGWKRRELEPTQRVELWWERAETRAVLVNIN